MHRFATRLGYSFAILIISAAGTTAHAVITPTCAKDDATVFTATGSLQSYEVPEGASTVLIQAFGASGGNVQDVEDVAFGAHSGGLGGAVTAEVPVTPGSTLDIVVGQEGESPSSDGEPAGGGGATAISVGGVPLVVAGGGGGAGVSEDGDNAQLGEDGSDGEGVYGGSGGTNGNGGRDELPERIRRWRTCAFGRCRGGRGRCRHRWLWRRRRIGRSLRWRWRRLWRRRHRRGHGPRR